MRLRLTAKQAFYELAKSSWEYSFFEFIDDFRSSHYNLDLISEQPEGLLDQKEGALLRSIVYALCIEADIPQNKIPKWVITRQWLLEPWFVSGVNNLYAMALVESPLVFRNNNIFVLNNFLSRV